MKIYFIQSGMKGPIKIGVAKCVESRMRGLQVGNPYKLRLLAVIDAKSEQEAFNKESRLHRLFRRQRIRGEWFRSNIQLGRIKELEPVTDETEEDAPFWDSKKWKKVRYRAFQKYGNQCACCGAKPSDGVSLHADHIKSEFSHPELALELDNLQILCTDCNIGKLNDWDTNWMDYHS